MADVNMRDILLQAVHSRLGIEVEVSDGTLFQQRFHQFRNKQRKQGDASFDCLTCRLMSDEIIYIINKKEPADGEETITESDDQAV